MNDELRVNKISHINPRKTPLNSKRKKGKREHKHKDEAGNHFQKLANAAEQAHDVLVKNKSPYRFCVYQKEGEVFIDIVIVDENGKIKEIKKKNITHDEFSTWLNHIEQGGGFFFDITA